MSHQKKITLISLIISLWGHLSRRRRNQFRLLLGLMLVSALAEVISLGAVLPFLAVLAVPDEIFNYEIIGALANTLGISTADELIFPLTLIFIVAAVVAGAVRIFLLWTSTRLAYAAGSDISIEAYNRTLFQPYRVHLSRNSSEVISGISSKVTAVAFGVLLSSLTFISSAVLLITIMVALLAINFMVAMMVAAGFGLSYGGVTLVSRKRLRSNSRRIAREYAQVVKALQEGLGGVRDVLLDGTQSVYCDVYRRAEVPLRRAQGNNNFIALSPRYAMEVIGMVLIAFFAFMLSRQEGGVAAALPVLGALALGAQRLLPALQQCFNSWAHVTGSYASLQDTIDLLEQPLPGYALKPDPEPMKFNDTIKFSDVHFRYSDEGPWVLNSLNLVIKKGSRVGLVGSTGAGKSTVLDLLMMLLEPTRGEILVDGERLTGERARSWQKTIAHVPQSIFLADTSLAENIAFGVPVDEIDMDRVKTAARQAQIEDFIESCTDGYNTTVGERGVRLSGGQRQRIGIARSLYRRASVLVFDEATSALDNMTESQVMRSLENLDRTLTIVIVAHRLTTVKYCDSIVEIDNGKVAAQGTYESMLEKSKSFQEMARAPLR